MTSPRTDVLPLLALKIAPRQFDLSYRFSNISLRDQIVRGQTLVRALLDTGLVKANAPESGNAFQLLICGAGAAGLAAAKEAAELGISFVLIEKGARAPGGVLCSTAQRYVSTAMYEWPHPNCVEHAYPLAVPSLLGPDQSPMPTLPLNLGAPVTVGDFGDAIDALLSRDIIDWANNFQAFVSGTPHIARRLFAANTTIQTRTKQALKAMLKGKASIHGVPLHDASLPHILLENGAIAHIPSVRVRYVIYAVGYAAETTEYAKGKVPYAGYEHKSFWEPDPIHQKNLGFTEPPHVGIVGSGDGALQDALRCLTDPVFPHALALWHSLLSKPATDGGDLKDSTHVMRAMAEVAAADSYTTGGAIWTSSRHIFGSLDKAFLDIIDRLFAAETLALQRAVGSLVRSDVGSVSVILRDGHFTKAYALNRFLILLFHRVLADPGTLFHGRLRILTAEVADFRPLKGNVRGGRLDIVDRNGAFTTHDFDLAIIRAGLDQNTSPTQLVGLSGMDTGRAELGRIPPSIRPIGMG
ncbi:MAG: NAD(P)-binding protein [Lysobacter sp.]|nr:NAD(P)-binding protein [Lysobacter sp.]